MRRQNYYTQVVGTTLTIVGNPNTNRRLTQQDIATIVNTVKNGFQGGNGAINPVDSLHLSQVEYPRTGNGFRLFIQQLMQIPHLISLDFDQESTLSHQLNAAEVRQLSQEVSRTAHLRKLSFRISWGQNSDACEQILDDLKSMLRANRSLTDFNCDFDDCIHNYALLRSIVATPNQLTNVRLSLTPFPEYQDDLIEILRNHPNINFIFEGNMTIQRHLQHQLVEARQYQEFFALFQPLRFRINNNLPQARNDESSDENLSDDGNIEPAAKRPRI
jgi:hypothetical protein